MLTPNQYEAIGRLALAANELEYAIEYQIAIIISIEFDVGLVIAEEDSFSKKIDRFRRILNALVSDWHGADLPGASSLPPAVENVLPILQRAKELSVKRNTYIHALVVEDFKTKTTKMMRGAKVLNFDEQDVRAAAEEISKLVSILSDACDIVYETVESLRAQVSRW